MQTINQCENPFVKMVHTLTTDGDPLIILTKGADIKGGEIRFVCNYSIYNDMDNNVFNLCDEVAVAIKEQSSSLKARKIASYDSGRTKYSYSPLNGKLTKLIKKVVESFEGLEDYTNTSSLKASFLADIKDGADGIIINNLLIDDIETNIKRYMGK